MNENWSPISKIWMGAAVAAFTYYSYASDYYKERLHIFARYSALQWYLSIYCTIFALGMVFFCECPRPTLFEFGVASIYAAFFTTVPYIMYFYVINKVRNMGIIAYHLTGILFVTLIAEILLFGIYPSIVKIVAVSLIVAGAGLTMIGSGKKKINGQHLLSRILILVVKMCLKRLCERWWQQNMAHN